MAESPTTAEDEGSEVQRKPAADEAFCTSCGEIIKAEAEVCPECGVRQKDAESSSGDYSDGSLPKQEAYELRKVAQKDVTMAMLLGLLISPLGYVYVGENLWALINFVTLNYLLFGIIIVPFHSRKMIKDARSELEANGAEW